MLTKINNLLNKYTNYKCDQILKCDHIYFGYTNNAYCIEFKNGEKIFVKLAQKSSINQINEGNIYKIYYPEIFICSADDGSLITKWIDNIKINNLHEHKDLLTKLIFEINKFHKLETKIKLLEFDYLKYEEILQVFDIENLFYKELVRKWTKQKLVISHNDINNKNLLMFCEHGQMKIKLIDFEWTTYNYEWWDYINYLAEHEIYDYKILNEWIEYISDVDNIKDIYEMLYIRWWYCLGWSIGEKNNLPMMVDYSTKCKNNIALIKKLLTSTNH